MTEASTANEASNDLERTKEEFGDAEMGDAVKVETEDPVDAFEERTVGTVFHKGESSSSSSCGVHDQDMGKIKDVKVKIPKLKISKKLSVNTKANPFSCDIKDCKLTFSHRGNLNKHIRNVHKKEKPHQCSQCMKKFSRKYVLNAHIDTVHNNNKKHQCNQCLKKFCSKGYLTVHIEVVHNKAKPYQCSQCLKKFSVKNSLRGHIIAVHKKEKPYQCIQCLKKFSQTSHLSRHLKTVHNNQ